MSHIFTSYETLDFRPAPAGWTVYYFTDAQGVMTAPLAGWEVRAKTRLYTDSLREVEDQPPLTERDRTIAPIDMDVSGCMDDPTEAGNFWMITGPGAAAPTSEEIAKEWTAWHAMRDRA